MWWRLAILLWFVQPSPARPDVLTFSIFPTSNPAHSVSCRMELRSGQINVVEVRGSGLPPRHPMRWPVRGAEEAAILSVLQALIIGDLPSIEIYSARMPNAPYVTVNWSTTVNDARVSGLYVQTGLVLPDLMAQLIDTIMPGSGCQTATR